MIAEFDTAYGHYQIVDMEYDGRPARVLFSGDRRAAQSGIARDQNLDLLFDYNQRLFEAVSAIATVNNNATVLIIGGGMLTLPAAVIKSFPGVVIDVVEIDAELHKYALQYFEVPNTPQIRVIQGDGLRYLKTTAQTNRRYDAIIFDAYTHDASEPSLVTTEAALASFQCLKPGGIVLANAIAAYYGRRAEPLITMQHNFASHFEHIALHPASANLSLWLPQNFIFAASNQPLQSITSQLRYPSLTTGYSASTALTPFDIRRDLL